MLPLHPSIGVRDCFPATIESCLMVRFVRHQKGTTTLMALNAPEHPISSPGTGDPTHTQAPTFRTLVPRETFSPPLAPRSRQEEVKGVI